MIKVTRTAYLLMAILFVLVSILAYLYLSDPQNGRIAYRLHLMVDNFNRIIKRAALEPPQGYTGKWTGWDSDGSKFEVKYIAGKLKGKITNWDADGNIFRISYYNEPSFLVQRWEKGKTICKGIVFNGNKWYGSFVSHTPDVLYDYYLNYVMVSESEYRKWEVDGGGLEKLLEKHPEILR